jgi:isopenicillin N synthase-like dioxygenase
MELDIVDFSAIMAQKHTLHEALYNKGIVGVRGVPDYLEASAAYIDAVRQFAALDDDIKKRYMPNRDQGFTEGYELGAEWFKDEFDQWQIDDKKASYYAHVPNDARNPWPLEVDIQTSYMNLGSIMFDAGKRVMDAVGLNEDMGLMRDNLTGFGRMLHYLKQGNTHGKNPNWCGGHYDHGIFTALMPAYYFHHNELIEEPEEAGLFIIPTGEHDYKKIHARDRSIMLFQVGEFGQLLSNDRIRATKHLVKKAHGNVERFTLALFIDPDINMVIRSTSELAKDARYAQNQSMDASISYHAWEQASYERYRAIV